MRYWRKELPQRPFYLPSGMPVRFDFVDSGYGFLASDTGYLNVELEKCAAKRFGGVTEISAGEFDSFLKKKNSLASLSKPQRSRPTIGPFSRRGLERLAQGVVAAAVINADKKMAPQVAEPQKVAGLTVDRTFVKPRIGKMPVSD